MRRLTLPILQATPWQRGDDRQVLRARRPSTAEIRVVRCADLICHGLRIARSGAVARPLGQSARSPMSVQEPARPPPTRSELPEIHVIPERGRVSPGVSPGVRHKEDRHWRRMARLSHQLGERICVGARQASVREGRMRQARGCRGSPGPRGSTSFGRSDRVGRSFDPMQLRSR